MKETVTHRRPKSSGSKQLFKSPILEKFTRTHIAIPVTIFSTFSIGIVFCAFTLTGFNSYSIIFLFCAGLLTFTLVEYLIHRFIYHLRPSSASGIRMQYLIHGVHHDYPKDKSRLAMPPIISVLIVFILLGITYLCIGEYAFAFLPGFVIGYAGYILVHYIIHAYPPPKSLFKILWIHHSIHHYKDSERAYGVSSPLWDYIFGTMPKQNKIILCKN